MDPRLLAAIIYGVAIGVARYVAHSVNKTLGLTR